MVAQDHPAERHISPAAAVEYLASRGIETTEQTLRRHMNDGSLPGVRVGEKKLYVTIDALERHFLTPIPLRDAIDEYIDDIVARAPELTQEQRDRLAVLIKDAPVPAGDKAAH